MASLLWFSIGISFALRGVGPFSIVGVKQKARQRQGMIRIESSSSNQQTESPQFPKISHKFAVAIIPPDTAWDTLQQARHWVQDSTVTTWPPAIRLFHPFLSDTDDAVFAMANCIEEINQQEFQITLSEWSIIPHYELLTGFLPPDEDEVIRDPELAEIKALIEREEAIGKVNKARRMKQFRTNTKPFGRPPCTNRKIQDASKKVKPTQPKTESDLFNGACVIVLEPDARSSQMLQDLRRSLRSVLPESFQDFYSCTSTMPHPRSTQHQSATEWRPVVPIASVSTTAAAIPLARHLRASWEPIQFNVTDLHVISSSSSDGGVFGCDALISFVGHEPIEMEDPVHQDMAYLVTDHGIPGGADQAAAHYNNPSSAKETDTAEPVIHVIPRGYVDADDPPDDNENFLSPELEQWLYNDEDVEDDGTVVVIDRVQFFTGNQRDYVGMPAISTMTDQISHGRYTKQNKRRRKRRTAREMADD